MASSNYGELKTALSNWLLRSDLDSRIPEFISLCEGRLQRNVRHWRQINRAAATVSNEFVPLPDDYLEAIALIITASGRDRRLEPITITQAQQMGVRRASSGQPRYFALYGEEFELMPTPDGSYDLEMVYYELISSLSADSDANWILTYYPDVYLYGSLLHSAPFLHEDERLPVWGSLYQQAMAELRADGDRGEFSGGPMTMRPAPGRVIGRRNPNDRSFYR